jgi:hypothetical protein
MRRIATMLAFAVVLVLPAAAQTTPRIFDVTVKQIFAVPQDSIAKAEQLQTAGTLSGTVFNRLTRSRYTDLRTPVDTLVRFTAVVLSDPFNSGLANVTNNRIDRVHLFVRDVAAASDPAGIRGYVIQIVDGAYDAPGNDILKLAPGNVVKFTGSLAYFGNQAQLSPTTIELLARDYRTLYPAALGQPVPVSIDYLNKPGSADTANPNNPQATLNFANFPLNASEYVRLEGLQVETNTAFGQRFNVTYANQARNVFVYQGDTSIRFRNDRNSNTTYQSGGFNVRSTPYVPPSVGSRVNVVGFTLPYTSDFVNYFNPNVSIQIVPFEDGDVVVTAGAPAVAGLTNASALVKGNAAETVTVNVQAAPGATLSSVVLNYRRGTTGAYTAVTMTAGTPTASGTPYTAQIPATALTDGSFIQYYAAATDNQNRTTNSDTRSFRVLTGGIRKIEHIQRTATGGTGDSPFTGATFTANGDFDLDAVVMSRPDTSGFVSIQDDPSLAAWSGIVLEPNTQNRTLRRGDRIRITAATVIESNGQTRLTNVTWTKTGTTTPYAHKVVTTTDLADASTAEAHEGMLVRVNNVTVTSTNADAPSNFGEFLVRSDGAAASATVRVDDFSSAIPRNLNNSLRVGTRYRYIQGLLDFSFGNFKIEPEVLSDLGNSAGGTAIGGEDFAAGLSLAAPSPNPARGVATLTYRTGTAAEVRIEVFDLTGRRVASLAEGVVLPGGHTATLGTADLAAGLYVVRLTQGAAAVTRPLVVVK